MVNNIKKRQNNSCGFTLLELLVSITILSLIITISYSALRLGTKSWDASIKNINNNSNTRSTIELLKNKIEHIYPIVWLNNAKRAISFEGNDESIRFIAPSPQGRELGEYFEYLIVINRTLPGASIELFYEPHDPGADNFLVDGDSPSRQMLNNLSNVKFSYYGQPDKNMEIDWFEEWPNDFDTFPSAVRIIIQGQENVHIDVNMVVKLQSEIY